MAVREAKHFGMIRQITSTQHVEHYTYILHLFFILTPFTVLFFPFLFSFSLSHLYFLFFFSLFFSPLTFFCLPHIVSGDIS